MISINALLDESNSDRYFTDESEIEVSGPSHESAESFSSSGDADEFDLFERARLIYGRARASQRVRSSNIV